MTRARRMLERLRVKALGLREPNPLGRFAASADAARNAVDIFKGEWASALPAELGVDAGTVPLFDDARLRWLNERLPVAGRTVLELGPLEGGHTWQLERFGAADILALEANRRAFLKCLVVKELLGLRRARFQCVDFMAWLDTASERFDLCVASGVLYHLRRPVALLERVSRAADGLFLWTHYYDEALVRRNRALAFRFAKGVRSEEGGFAHTLYRREYGAGLFSRPSFGGNAAYSHWLSRADLLAAIAHFGWTSPEIAFEQTDHPNGPCLALLATRAGRHADSPHQGLTE